MRVFPSLPSPPPGGVWGDSSEEGPGKSLQLGLFVGCSRQKLQGPALRGEVDSLRVALAGGHQAKEPRFESQELNPEPSH